MKKEEALELLRNRKVFVGEKGKEVQEKLFSLGFKWHPSVTKIIALKEFPFIYIDREGMTCGDSYSFYVRSPYKEITTDEILDIDIDAKYRPFFDKTECIKEMKKHDCFGWVFDKDMKVAYNLTMISTNYCGMMGSFGQTFKKLFDTYVFLDGEPFGIKE